MGVYSEETPDVRRVVAVEEELPGGSFILSLADDVTAHRFWGWSVTMKEAVEENPPLGQVDVEYQIEGNVAYWRVFDQLALAPTFLANEISEDRVYRVTRFNYRVRVTNLTEVIQLVDLLTIVGNN